MNKKRERERDLMQKERERDFPIAARVISSVFLLSFSHSLPLGQPLYYYYILLLITEVIGEVRERERSERSRQRERVSEVER